MKPNLKLIFRTAALLCAAAVLSFGSLIPSALATSSISIASDTNVLLTGPGITLTLAAGSTLVSYTVDTSTLNLNLDSTSSVTVKSSNLYTLTNSQNQTTQCSGTNYSYVSFAVASSTAITLTPSTTIACPPSNGGGGGGGGSIIVPPVITSFAASPATIQLGQASTLSWAVSGASTLRLTPASSGQGGPTVSTTTLNALSGTMSVSPTSTTAYTLTAANLYSQSVATSTTVTVLPAGSPLPPVTPPPITQRPASSSQGRPLATNTPAYCLVNSRGTFSLILSGIRHGIANPGLLFSYGYGFNDAGSDTYQSLPSGSLLGPNDGALVKTSNNPTVYLISDSSTHGFTSAAVFLALGYKFSSVLMIPAPQLAALPTGAIIADPTARHLEGDTINNQGTIYLLSDTTRSTYPSLAVFNSWNLHNNFSFVLPANAADLSLPLGPTVTPRTTCSGQ